MNNAVVIGQTNVGKTRFVIEFARSINGAELKVTRVFPSGEKATVAITPEQALKELTSQSNHETLCIQSITLRLPVGKGVKTFDLVDTSGLADGIHPKLSVREAMAQTLTTLRDASLVFHVIDAAKAGRKGHIRCIGDVDYNVASFAQMRDGYVILASKVDLADAKRGVELIKREFPGNTVIPVSSITKEGFQEVKRFVRDRL